jgi:ASC-1-like (ASCH) protein
MSKRHLKIRPEWGEALRTGRKDIDARPAGEDVAGLEVGNVVRYPAVHAQVQRIAFYRGYRDLLAVEDWRRIAPDAANQEEAISLLEDAHAGIPHTTGVVAIEVTPVHE